MSLRLLRILVQATHYERVEEILAEHDAGPRWCMPMQDDRTMVEVVLPAAGNEPVLDDLENAFRDTTGFRLLFFPIEATIPRIEAGTSPKGQESAEDPPPDPAAEAGRAAAGGATAPLPAGRREGGESESRGPESGSKGSSDAMTAAAGPAQRSDHSRSPQLPTQSPEPAAVESRAAGTGTAGSAVAGTGAPRSAEAPDDGPGSTAPEQSATEAETRKSERKRTPLRVNREELYTDLAEASKAGRYYLVMVGLSAVVACAGLLLGDGAVIIGAMVIAPLIGPNIGVAFATTLGDLALGRKALLTSIMGVATALVVSLIAGFFLQVDPSGEEILGRTELTFEHLALALAAGAAGALAMARGVGTGLVGVMVAVALLPPLATAGLLLGDGYTYLGVGALVLVVGNVVCINLAATVTFLIQGIRPNTWWEEDTRTRAVWTASILWLLLLATLIALIWLGFTDVELPTPD